jgi:hypothetical protein
MEADPQLRFAIEEREIAALDFVIRRLQSDHKLSFEERAELATSIEQVLFAAIDRPVK